MHFSLFYVLEEKFLSSEFFSLLSDALNNSELELLFGVAFVFTVETGFIPSSLAKHFDSTDSNIRLAKMLKNSLPINSFWHQDNKIFTTELVMSNELCHMVGIPLNGNSLIITLSYLNISKCTVIDCNILNKPLLHFYIKYKNEISVPIKCAILEITRFIGQNPSLCGIPEELVLYIMRKLDATSLIALMKTCTQIKSLAVDQNLWRKLVKEEFNLHIEYNQKLVDVPIIDWRKYFIDLKKERLGRKKTIIIREYNVLS